MQDQEQHKILPPSFDGPSPPASTIRYTYSRRNNNNSTSKSIIRVSCIHVNNTTCMHSYSLAILLLPMFQRSTPMNSLQHIHPFFVLTISITLNQPSTETEYKGFTDTLPYDVLAHNQHSRTFPPMISQWLYLIIFLLNI